jgi:hypothetical protein
MTDFRLILSSPGRLTARALPYLPGTLVAGTGIDVVQVGTTYTIAWNATEAGFSAFGMQLGGAVNAAAAHEILDLTISVKDFGAVGDGVTNDTVAIQAAINAAEAITITQVPLGGFQYTGAVYLPQGHYLVSGLTLTKPIRMFGDGEQSNTFIRLANGSNTSVITSTISDMSAFPRKTIFENFTIDGNRDNNIGTSFGINLVDTTWAPSTKFNFGAVLRDVTIHSCKSGGLFIGENRNNGAIFNSQIKFHNGPSVQNQAFDWLIEGSELAENTYGLLQDGGGSTFLSNCLIYTSSENCIRIENCVGYFFLNNNQIANASKHGLFFNGASNQDHLALVVTSCQFIDNSSSANDTYSHIHALNTYGLTVAECWFERAGSATNHPKYIIETSGGGPVRWDNNRYRTDASQPYITAVTNDFSKLNSGDPSAVAVGRGAALSDTAVINGTAEFFKVIEGNETENGANPGPYIVLRRISASPAAADRLGVLAFDGKDSAGNDIGYAGVECAIVDPTNGSEDGELNLQATVGGTANVNVLRASNGVQVGAPTGGYPGLGAIAVENSIKSTGPTAGIGYATGAGGTVTQITSKATGVTLNKITGQITMDAANLAADTTVSFVLTNSAIAAGDTLILNHISGGTAGSYTLNARSAAGSATIDVRNVTAGALAEAIVIAFAVIKAVTS